MKYLIFAFILVFDFTILDDYDEFPESIRNFMESLEKCQEAGEDKELCFSKTSLLNTPNYQCCILEYIDHEGKEVNCSLTGQPIEKIKEQKNSIKLQAFIKEIVGFQIYKMDFNATELRHIQKYDCHDGNFEIRYGYEEYSSDDKVKLKSDKHCLRYFYSPSLDPYNFKDNFPTNSDCYNADLLQSSKEVGVKCGYSEFNIKFLDGKSEVYKTCYFYDSDAVKTKSYDEQSTINFDQYVMMVTQGQYLSYTVEISDDSGNKLKYDSLTKEVTVPSTSNSSSKGVKDYKSKYLLLLILILL